MRSRPIAGYRLVKDTQTVGRLPAKIPIHTSAELAAVMWKLTNRECTESFYAVAFDPQYCIRPSGICVITRGTVNTSLVHPREVFRALIAANAVAGALVHNHPSGDPTPSELDKEVTRIMVAAGKLLDIPIVDHLILGEDQFVSFNEAGLLT